MIQFDEYFSDGLKPPTIYLLGIIVKATLRIKVSVPKKKMMIMCFEKWEN